jgi:hypothetical protein
LAACFQGSPSQYNKPVRFVSPPWDKKLGELLLKYAVLGVISSFLVNPIDFSPFKDKLFIAFNPVLNLMEEK